MKNMFLALPLITLTAAPAWAAEDAFKAFVTGNVAGWMANPAVQAALTAANTAHASLSEPEILDLDTQWRAEIGTGATPLIDSVMTAPVSNYLREIVAQSQGAIAEIILMDSRGLNAGVSAVTSDYWQGDEAKYQNTFAVGVGAIDMSDVELDESTGTYVVQVSVPVQDSAGALVGAATFSLDAERF